MDVDEGWYDAFNTGTDEASSALAWLGSILSILEIWAFKRAISESYAGIKIHKSNKK